MVISDIVGFCHERALILYVYLPSDEVGGGDESVLTVYSFASILLGFADSR